MDSNQMIDSFLFHMIEEFPTLAQLFSHKKLSSTFGSNLESSGPIIKNLILQELKNQRSSNTLCSKDCKEYELKIEQDIWNDRAECIEKSMEKFGPMIFDLHTLILHLSRALNTSQYYSDIARFLKENNLGNLSLFETDNLEASFTCVLNFLSQSGILNPHPSSLKLIFINSSLGLLNVNTLRLFRNLPIDSLNLNSPTHFSQDLLSVLALPNSFIKLQSLDLSGVQLNSQQLRYLKNLFLIRLNLSKTNLTNDGIEQLLGLKDTLLNLKVNDNLQVDNQSLPLLNKFSLLITLDIFSTSITLEGPLNDSSIPSFGLRNFITRAKLIQPNLRAISPPSSILTLLLNPSSNNSLKVQTIPEKFISHPDQIETIDTAAKLKKNILHLDPEVQVNFFSVKLRKILAHLLNRRIDNIRCLKLMEFDRIKEAKDWK